MRTHTYTIPVGKDTNAKFHGVEITTDQPETSAEAIPKFYENEAALIAAANRDRMIQQNRKVRGLLAKEDGDVAKATAEANAIVVKAPRPESDGTAKPKSSGAIKKLKADVEAANAERTARLDGYRNIRDTQPGVWKNMVKYGAVTQADQLALDAPTEPNHPSADIVAQVR